MKCLTLSVFLLAFLLLQSVLLTSLTTPCQNYTFLKSFSPSDPAYTSDIKFVDFDLLNNLIATAGRINPTSHAFSLLNGDLDGNLLWQKEYVIWDVFQLRIVSSKIYSLIGNWGNFGILIIADNGDIYKQKTFSNPLIYFDMNPQ
jgi:hypothetical protein